MRPRTIRRLGDILASAMSGAATAAVVLILTNNFGLHEPGPVNVAVITPHPFAEPTGRAAVSGSALVPIADSTFLVIDDLTDDAFFELAFGPDGKQSGPLTRRPISGLTQGLVEDLEGAAMVESAGRRVIAAVSSLESGQGENTAAGLVRVTVGSGGELAGEVMPGFRDWLVASYPELSAGADQLEVQGLVWDPNRSALLLAVRSPAPPGEALLLPVRVKDWAGPWETANLEATRAIALDFGDANAGRGILGLAYYAPRREHLVLVGTTVGATKDAVLFEWDGGDSGAMRRVPRMVFHPAMKPEGIAFGTIGGRPAAVVVDDNGGYFVLWQDEFDSYLAT